VTFTVTPTTASARPSNYF